WHQVLRMLLFCLTSFALLCVVTYMPVQRSVGFNLALGFGLLFIGAWQELLNSLIHNRWLAVRVVELLCMPLGLLVATLGLYQLGKSYRMNRLILTRYKQTEHELVRVDQLTQLYTRPSFY